MKRYWLETLSIVAAIMLLAGSFNRKVVQPAREAARRTQCKNNLRVLNGVISLDMLNQDHVRLNAADQVDAVRTTSVISVADIVYHRPDGSLAVESELPFETVMKAKLKLHSEKLTPEWQKRREEYSSIYESLLSHSRRN